MNTRAKISFSHSNKKNYEAGGSRFTGWIKSILNGSDYEQGELESLQAGLDNAHEFIAYLSLVLIEKGILTKEDILKIVEPESLGYTAEGNFKWPENTETTR